MKKGLFIVAIIAAFLMPNPFASKAVEEIRYDVMADNNDTVWKICADLYDPKDIRCFNEFLYDTRKENNLLGKNVLQAGQIIKVVVKKQK